jgi:hypothetical protein
MALADAGRPSPESEARDVGRALCRAGEGEQAMPKDSKAAAAAFTPETVGYEALSKSVLQQTEWWLQAQTELFSRLQAANTRWLEHRKTDFGNGLEVLRQLAACRDFGEAAAIQQKWLAQCLRSAAADWTDLMSPFAEHGHTHAKRVREREVSVQRVPERAAA